MKTMLFFLALCCVCCGCDYFGSTSVWEAVISDWPSHWRETFPNLTADLVTAGADGSVHYGVISPAALRFPVRINKLRNSVVLVYGGTGAEHERLRPLGAVFPAAADFKTRTITLSVVGGYVAERLFRLMERGCDVQSFNTERLIALLQDKETDPWSYDPIVVENRLAEKNFSVYALKHIEARSVFITSLGEGTWFSESPVSPLWETGVGGELDIPALTCGYHALYRYGTDDRIYLMVASEEVIIFGCQ